MSYCDTQVFVMVSSPPLLALLYLPARPLAELDMLVESVVKVVEKVEVAFEFSGGCLGFLCSLDSALRNADVQKSSHDQSKLHAKESLDNTSEANE